MFTISAFADEISPDPQQQIDVLKSCRVRHIELRSIHQTNVLALTDLQVIEFKSLLDTNGFKLSAIGSPIGKIKIDEPFEPHFQRYERAIHLCTVFGTPNIRLFSFYPPGDTHDWNNVETKWEREVFNRMEQLVRRAEKEGVVLFHENEHRIYGDNPHRVVKLMRAVPSLSLRMVYDGANYVYGGYDAWEGWQVSKVVTAHFHAKDWKAGEPHGCLMGHGGGRWQEVINDAVSLGYKGFATMEPHLLGGGPTGGHTGPELFPKAVEAFRVILNKAGAVEG